MPLCLDTLSCCLSEFRSRAFSSRLLAILTQAYKHRSRTLDPIFALLIGFSAAGIRIHREENEKRKGMATTSITGSTVQMATQKLEAGDQNGPGGEIGYGDLANIEWGRIKKRISVAVPW